MACRQKNWRQLLLPAASNEVARHADDLLLLVDRSVPEEAVEVPVIHGYIAGMFWRARRLYEGVLLLVRAHLPEESAILARSLFDDSMRLQQLEAEPAHRTALVLRWAKDSIAEERGLLMSAVQCGLDTDVSPMLTRLDERLREIGVYAKRHNVKKARAFQQVKDAAFRFGRKEDYWTYEWAHEAVHGTDIVWMHARVAPTEGSAMFHGKTSDPGTLATSMQFAARSMADAASATFAIFEWMPVPDFHQPVRAIDQLIDTVRRSLNE